MSRLDAQRNGTSRRCAGDVTPEEASAVGWRYGLNT
jgi:hypothetical protein